MSLKLLDGKQTLWLTLVSAVKRTFWHNAKLERWRKMSSVSATKESYPKCLLLALQRNLTQNCVFYGYENWNCFRFNSGTSSRWCFFFCLWIWICVEAGKLEKPVLKPPDGKDAILRQIEPTCDVRCGRRTQATVAKTMVLTTASYLIPMFKWSQNWSL